MLAIQVKGLVKRYPDKVAVDGIDLEIRKGEIFALLGPNGAGKTTTVEILEGYRDRDAGEVLVLSQDPKNADLKWRNKIGIVLQSTKDSEELTVKEVVEHFANYYKDSRNSSEVIEAVGLTEKQNSRIETLSGGQRRRLDVALGIIGKPEILFLDEPTTGFDPEARRQFWVLIEKLKTEGTTILLTTHYLDEAEALADRLAVISNGKIIEVATPKTLGNRDNAKAVITWQEDGAERSVESDSPTKFVKELSEKFAGEIPGLKVVRPSLEDIYLKMIGSDHA